MKTGTDISIAECRVSGYPVVSHGKGKMNPDKQYELTISNPDAWTDNGRLKTGHPVPYDFDSFISYRKMWETFEDQGRGIKDFCDFENCPLPSPEEEPCFHDFVSLASILDPYCGVY